MYSFLVTLTRDKEKESRSYKTKERERERWLQPENYFTSNTVELNQQKEVLKSTQKKKSQNLFI